MEPAQFYQALDDEELARAHAAGAKVHPDPATWGALVAEVERRRRHVGVRTGPDTSTQQRTQADATAQGPTGEERPLRVNAKGFFVAGTALLVLRALIDVYSAVGWLPYYALGAVAVYRARIHSPIPKRVATVVGTVAVIVLALHVVTASNRGADVGFATVLGIFDGLMVGAAAGLLARATAERRR